MISRPLDNKFGEWAFGEYWKAYLNYECDPVDLLRAWNLFHGKIYCFKSLDHMYTKLPVMIQQYKEARGMNGQKDASSHQENGNSGEGHQEKRQEECCKSSEESAEEEREVSEDRSRQARSHDRKSRKG